MNNEKAITLLKQYEKGTISHEDCVLLECWYLAQAAASDHQLSPEKLEESYALLKAQLPAPTARQRTLWPRLAAAAAILLLVSAGSYFLLRGHHENPENHLAMQRGREVGPGGNHATLTLANGKQIMLAQAGNGQLARQNNMLVIKTTSGQLRYQSDTRPDLHFTEKIAYNTISTPRGGKYNLTLADGTKITLDAASSIRYPVVFNGTERRVEITGQVYFEVSHNASKPFYVVTHDQLIEDIGTSFNVNAYEDEPQTITTLVQGRVSIGNGDQKTLLKPGEQAVTSSKVKNGRITVSNIDTEEAMAWKNGNFSFNNEDIQSIMRKLSRWYNVDIDYTGVKAPGHFNGVISRNVNLSQVMKMLDFTGGIHYTIENRTMRLTNKGKE